MSIVEEILGSKNQIVSYGFSDMNRIMEEKWGGEWKDYRKRWKMVAEEPGSLEDIPLYLVLELNSFCNLKCIMCKHSDDAIDLPRKSMDMSIIKKVCAEMKELGIPSVNIGSGTECTLHPHFREIALMIKETGAIDKFFLTNGTTLTEKMVDIIFEGDYERVEVSVDAATSETYASIRRNGSLDRVEKGVNALLDRKKKLQVKTPIVRLSFCVQERNKSEIDAFYEKWRDKVDVIEYQKVSVPDKIKTVDEMNMACCQPFNRLTVNYDGNIYPCCSILYQDSYCLGNIDDMTLLDAWRGEKMERLRQGIINKKPLPHCEQCMRSQS